MQKWAVLGREFTVAGGELSPSLKLKRSGYLNISTQYTLYPQIYKVSVIILSRFSVHEMYKKEIDAMYLHEGHSSVAW